VRKPSFSVVTLVVVTLGILGLGLRWLSDYLPSPSPNRLESETADFLHQAAHQPIDWYTLGDRAFSDARRTDRPILLVLGTCWSTEARRMDQFIFSNAEIASFLARNFICVRVDLDESPQWRTAFLPVSRYRYTITSGFQMFYLDPQGRMFDFYPRRGVQPLSDPVIFLDEFVSARKRYEEVRTGDGGPIPAGALQQADLEIIASTRPSFPDRNYFGRILINELDPQYGGFSRQGQVARPHALDFFMLHGEGDAWQAATRSMLRSGMVDWLDGGFYRVARNRDWTGIEFDKLALHNAEMMLSVGLGGQLLQDPFNLRIAKNTFDALTDRFGADSWIATARIGDEDLRGRSAYASFAVKDLRRVGGTGKLTSEETDLARDFFGLSVETNPQMLMQVGDPTEFGDAKFDALIAKLRDMRKGTPPPYSRVPYANVNFGVAAALFRAARMWNEPDRIARAERLLGDLEPFVSGRDVTHRMPQQVGDRPLLPDYLNASEAFLEHYLATGRVDSLERGLRLMRRAKMLFSADGQWLLALHKTSGLEPEGTSVPELLDTPTEASTARVMRLLSVYGLLLRGGPEAKLAGQFSGEALELCARYGALMPEIGIASAGYMSSSARILDDRHAIVVGDDAVAQARELFSRVPTRLVAPAFGDVRVDLQRRKPGVYLVDGSSIVGPLTVDEAATQLPRALDPNRLPGDTP